MTNLQFAICNLQFVLKHDWEPCSKLTRVA